MAAKRTVGDIRQTLDGSKSVSIDVLLHVEVRAGFTTVGQGSMHPVFMAEPCRVAAS
jgi:hypothetical protein